MTPKSWKDFEAARLELQRHSPRFSRAELCRRAGIDQTTFLKGLKSDTPPRPSKRSAVARQLAAEAETVKPRLSTEDRQRLELILAGEQAAIAAGLR